jgi:hypothetical protein
MMTKTDLFKKLGIVDNKRAYSLIKAHDLVKRYNLILYSGCSYTLLSKWKDMIIDFVNERYDYTILLTGGLKNNKVFKFDEKEYKFDELNLKNNKEAIEKMKHMDDIFMEADDEDFDESEELAKISDKMSETKLDDKAIDKKMNDVEEVIPASVQKKVKNVPAPVQQKVNDMSALVQKK